MYPTVSTLGGIADNFSRAATDTMSYLGESAFKNVLAPGVEAYYNKVIRETPVGTPEYIDAQEMLETAQLRPPVRHQ